jgi:hypothetical protein
MRRLAPSLLALAIAGCFVSIGEVDPDGTGGAGGSAGSSGGAGGAGTGGTAGAGGTGGSGASTDAGSDADDGAAGAAGTTSDSGTLLFSDDFGGGLASWVPLGTGNWTNDSGEAHQTDPTADLALLYVPKIDSANYRVVVRMRQVGSSNLPGGAVEIAFRIDPSTPELYHCNWEPNYGRIVIQYRQGNTDDVLYEKFVTLPVGYDPFATFTMQASITAAQISCEVLEMPGSAIAAGAAPLFPSGHVGLKTWMMAGAFDDFQVYAE